VTRPRSTCGATGSTSPLPEWPDWSGQAVAIIASGPSTKKAGVGLLKDRITTFAIKGNVELAPWSAAVYGCDFGWWNSVRGLPDFTGPKFAYADRACDRFHLTKIHIPKVSEDRILTETTGTVGAGGNSGFQALNLAVQFGAKRLLLIGFDCHDRGGVHWYGRNTAHGMGNPGDSNFRRWVPAFEAAASQLQDMGVEVVNASPDSAIKGFRKQSVAETLTEWGLD
jgi:hypothetical protein